MSKPTENIAQLRTALGTEDVDDTPVDGATTAPISSNWIFNNVGDFLGTITANDIDLSSGDYFTQTISSATTFTVSNVNSSGIASAFILDLTNGGSDTITWWSGLTWVAGTAPTLTASGRDALGFFTHDGGTTWTGLVLGLDIKAVA